MKQITVKDLKDKLDQKDDFLLLDVREAFERDICKLEPDTHIPMNEIQSRYGDLPTDKPIVVYCRSGQRSMNVCNYLETQGFEDVTNLQGGILAWADEIDPTLEKY
ncbi:MAG: hypothetical protein KDD48_04430 [Bdellovibrionales bacterium]|nr:hypothetical protein [Bdellovibrionales bacterium]